MKADEKEITMRDAIIAGILKAFLLEVIPQNDPVKREVTYLVRGNVDEVLQKISENAPIGSRDVLDAIKNCRSAIYLFRRGGQNG